jgi:hypothetical protein
MSDTGHTAKCGHQLLQSLDANGVFMYFEVVTGNSQPAGIIAPIFQFAQTSK